MGRPKPDESLVVEDVEREELFERSRELVAGRSLERD
jgi:hypothetical protein